MTSHVSHPAGLAAELATEALTAAHPESVLIDIATFTGGRAAETHLVRYRAATQHPELMRRGVLRIARETGPTAGTGLTCDVQFRLLQHLRQHQIPVPTPLASGRRHEAAYLMTEFLAGEVPSPWSTKGRSLLGSEPLRHTLPDALADLLSRIHRVELAGLGYLPGSVDDPAIAELERWMTLLNATPFAEDPVIVWTEAVLRSSLGRSPKATLVHGDFRLGNLVVKDMHVSGVLDWEMADIGDPWFDLALLCAPPVAADWDRCGLPPLSTVIDGYEARQGPIDRGHLSALTVLATLKVVALWTNGSRSVDDIPTVSTARNALSSWASRKYLLSALNIDQGRGKRDSARNAWQTEIQAELDARRKDGTIESARLPERLRQVPDPHPDFEQQLQSGIDSLCSDLGVVPTSQTSASRRLTSLIRQLTSRSDETVVNDARTRRRVEELISIAGDPELAVSPW